MEQQVITHTAQGTHSKKFKTHGTGRVFAAMASVVVAVALTACGSGSSSSSTTPATSNPPQSGGNTSQTDATRFNIQDSSLLYTTSEAIAISQLQSGLAARGSALPVFVPGRNASGQSAQSERGATMAGLQAGIASSNTPRNSSAFNLVAVGNDGISRQAIESQYFNRVLYTALPPAFNSLTGKTLTDKNVYIAFSSESLPNDSNDYSEFIRLNQPDQPCAFYRVNLSSNSHECVLPGVEPLPYFDTDFGKIEGNGRKPIQFDAQGNVYLVGQPFSVVNNKVSKASYAVLYKIDSKTLSASPLTQNNESVSFFSVLSSGEPVIALSTGTGYNLILFTKTGARRTLESGVSDPFVTLDSYRSVLYGNASPGSSGIKAFRTNDQEKLEQVALDYSPNANANATGSRYSLQTGGKTYTNPIPRRIIFGDDGKFYTVYSATPTAAANGAAALLIYQTLPFAKDPVAAIQLKGDWWTWMKSRPIQIKRGILYYAEQINRNGIGLVDVIRVVRLSTSNTVGSSQTLFADQAYTIHSWKALGDTLAFSGIDNDKNQLVQGQVDTLAIARQRDWSDAAWARFTPITVKASASASKGTATVQDMETLLPQQPLADTGLEPAILTFESTEKSALISFTKYMDKPSVQTMLQIQPKKAGLAAPQMFQVWGYQNLFLIYDSSNAGLLDADTSGLPAGGSNSFEISSTGYLLDAYSWSISKTIRYLVSEKPDGSYALAAPEGLSISSQPASQTVDAGQTATFSVAATGTGSISYQWRKDGNDIAGATQSSYSFAATSIDNDTVFAVAVSNASGTLLSNNASLWVLSAPAIRSQPAARTVTAGQTATFSVEATGTAPLRYQWRKNGSNISGATSSTYTTPGASLGDSGAGYSVVVSNAAGTVTSNSAALTVALATVAPAINTQPANRTVTAGETATFWVTATGTGPFNYQWKKNGTDISGATSSSYTTPATSSADSGAQYSVVVSNSAGTVASSSATLTVTVPPAISTQPASQTVMAGQTASFSVAATGTAPLTYQWRKNGSNISGATSSTYTTPATVSADNNAVFTVVVSNSAGTVASNSATLTVIAPPAISTQPAARTVTAGQTATFSVAATGTGTLAYQWRKNGTNISGATSSTYTTPATVSADNNAVFTVVVSNSAGTVTSSNATLTVTSVVASTPKLPHSGITSSQCYQAGSNTLVSCSSSGAQALNSRQDGNRTSINARSYSLVPNASGGTYAITECVKDNITGLVWEGKTASGTRAGSNTYTNYDSTASAQKSNGSNPTQAEIDASTNSMGYRNAVRASALCGFTDWRLPTVKELQTLVNYGVAYPGPTIDTTWFPNTQGFYYWSSSPYVGVSSSAWDVGFSHGDVGSVNRDDINVHVRLVR